jgi:hypothetical protein
LPDSEVNPPVNRNARSEPAPRPTTAHARLQHRHGSDARAAAGALNVEGFPQKLMLDAPVREPKYLPDRVTKSTRFL